MNAPFFSVIIPAYNRANLISRAIDSVLTQTFRDFELIVIDDGSKDGTAEIAAASAPEARVFRQENLGPGPARNRGVAEAHGTYVAFLDSDDVWFPWTLATYNDAITQHSQPPCLFGCVTLFSDSVAHTALQSEALQTRQFEDYLSTLGSDVYRGTGVAAIRADLIRENGGFFRERIFCEDLDFFMRMGTTGPVISITRPTMIGLYAHAENSITDIERSYEGTCFLLSQEKRGRYPGERARRKERAGLLLEHTRGVLRACINCGEMKLAWKLYRKIVLWMLERGEFRAVAGLGRELVTHKIGHARGIAR